MERTSRSDREYDDGMRKSAITYDAILAALAVLSAGTAACSKAERAAAEPATATPAATTTASAAAPSIEPTPASPPPPAPIATAGPLVDAGAERKLPVAAPSNSKPGKGASAACGAGSCSAEMKKNK